MRLKVQIRKLRKYCRQNPGGFAMIEAKRRLSLLERFYLLSLFRVKDENIQGIQRTFRSCLQDLMCVTDIDMETVHTSEANGKRFDGILESLDLYINIEEKKIINAVNSDDLRAVILRVDETLVPLWEQMREMIVPLNLDIRLEVCDE